MLVGRLVSFWECLFSGGYVSLQECIFYWNLWLSIAMVACHRANLFFGGDIISRAILIWFHKFHRPISATQRGTKHVAGKQLFFVWIRNSASRMARTVYGTLHFFHNHGSGKWLWKATTIGGAQFSLQPCLQETHLSLLCGIPSPMNPPTIPWKSRPPKIRTCCRRSWCQRGAFENIMAEDVKPSRERRKQGHPLNKCFFGAGIC